MATLTVQDAVPTGLDTTHNAAAGGGDEFANTGSECILVTNGSGGSLNVTIATNQTVVGLTVPDSVVTIPDGEAWIIGPFATRTFNDGSGNVALSYSATTSVTVAVFKVEAAN